MPRSATRSRVRPLEECWDLWSLQQLRVALLAGSWMQPPRHALGALLLEQGEVAEAATVFAADLAAHPGGNIWALHGLAECEERGAPIALPTPPTESEANAALSLAERLAQAQRLADVEVRASCFCRLDVQKPCCGGGPAEGTPPTDGKA